MVRHEGRLGSSGSSCMQQTSLNSLTMTCDDLRKWGQRTKSLHTFANYEKSDTRSRTCKHSASALRLREVRHLQSSPETHETQVRRNARGPAKFP